MKKIIAKTLLVFYFALVTLSCSKDESLNNPGVTLEVKKKEFVENYVNIVLASYEDTLNNLYDLESAIDAFVDNPTDASFKEAKNKWIISRELYGQTESFRYYDGPIDGSEGEPEGYINAWPLDEALIDYVTDGSGGQDLSDTRQNIINNTTVYPILTKDILRDISGYNSNESNVSIGYHVIEFLLWGQDNTEPSLKLNGQRPFTDYTTETNATRRGQYLKIVTALLVEDVKSVVEQWKPGASYRSSFLALHSDIAITKILTGAAKLSKGELAGERMVVAVENQNQEDEQSCFSDNTHRDIYSNAQSINNIINGSYKTTDGSSISGTSLLDVLKLVSASDANTLSSTATEVMNKVETISNAGHFDHQIMTETIDNFDNPVMSAVKSLRKQGDELAKAGKLITGETIDPSV